LRENARKLDAAGAQVIESDALAYLAGTPEPFDVVFLDPPFASDLGVRALARLAAWVHPGSRVYVESGEGVDAGPAWRAIREDRAGAVRYALFEPA
jgi:16S rRNA (guanine966-N2)-methyltransferase